MRKDIGGILYEMNVPDRNEDNDRRYFVSIDRHKCNGCGVCRQICPTGAIVGNTGSPHAIPHVEPCIHCGMCLIHCPERAIFETHSWLDEVKAAIANPDIIAVAMPAPSVRHSLKSYCRAPRFDVSHLRGALDVLGFNHCFDVQFGADVTIYEEGKEFLLRLKGGGPWPQLNSCCPAWVRYAETFYPQLLPHISSCKPPVPISGCLAKTWACHKLGYKADKIYTVAITPCIAKKYEALKSEMSFEHPDVDAVLTVREFLSLLDNLDFKLLPSAPEDRLMGSSSWAGAKFCIGGGVMEALLRFVAHALTGKAHDIDIGKKREGSQIRAMNLKIGEYDLRCATVTGAHNFAQICDEIIRGESPYHFIEFMACPGGCMGGGGQPVD